MFTRILLLKNKLTLNGCRFYAKEIKFGNEGKTLLLKGAETLANVVSVTLGPKACSVIVDAKNPKISKDGAFVANSISLEDSYENIGVQIMKKMADTTNKEASNGTKSATVLAKAIAKEGYNRIIKGSNPVEIRKGILDAVDVVSKQLDKLSRLVIGKEDIEKVATVFAGGDGNLGKVVADALTLVGKDGIITVKESEEQLHDTAELSRGVILESGYFMCNFPVDKSGRIKLENVLLLIYNGKIENFQNLVPALEIAVKKHKSLVIIAEDFSSNVAITFAVNHEGVIGIKLISIKIPSDKEFDKDILKDLAYACGGKVCGDESSYKSLNNIDESYIGEVPEVVITKKETVCVHGSNELMLEKAADLRLEIAKIKSEDVKKKLEERLARLESNIVIISIDGTNKDESKKKKDKIYTIIESTKVAMEQGIVPGGGSALVRCTDAVKNMKSPSDDHKIGVKILAYSLSAPFNTIIQNSHGNPAPILVKLKSLPSNIGYDVVTDSYVDAYEAGIIDATKAVKCALTNAANTASLMVNAEAVIVYKFDGTEIVL